MDSTADSYPSVEVQKAKQTRYASCVKYRGSAAVVESQWSLCTVGQQVRKTRLCACLSQSAVTLSVCMTRSGMLRGRTGTMGLASLVGICCSGLRLVGLQ
jgi:hypothetical protein